MAQIKPSIPQYEFITSKHKYPAFVAGYGAGKTEALVTRSIIQKLQNPKTDRAFYEPTYDLVRMIAFPRFEEKLTEHNIPYRLAKSPHNLIEIEGMGRIIFRSMDTPSRIIGYEVADSDVDELDTLKTKDAEDVWRKILARNRQKKDGQNTVAVATTPEGFGFVYQMWELNKREGYEIIRAPTYSNPYLPDDYIDSLRATYPAHLIDAYIEGLFVNLTSGTVYHEFSRKKNDSKEEIEGLEPLFIGMDFNVGNMSAVVHIKRQGNPIAVEEITKAYDTPDMCGIIKSRYGKRQIYVYPDASGGSRKSVDASLTDLEILRSAGFSVISDNKNPFVKDRVNAMNKAFSDGVYKVNTGRCPEYARCLEQQVYNKNGEPDKTQGLDHLTDAGGYFIAYEYPLIKPVINLKMGYMK